MLQGLKQVSSTFLDIVSTRSELFVLEFGEEKHRIAKSLLFLVFSAICLFFLLFAIAALVLMAVWESPYRLWYMGGIALFFALGFLITGCQFLSRARQVPFSATVDMLKEDVARVHASEEPKKKPTSTKGKDNA